MRKAEGVDTMRFIDFFAGVGGFREGMQQAGHTCVGFCEFDKYAVASYTSMHLITESQREYLEEMDVKKRQKEILKEEYKNGEWYANDIRGIYGRRSKSNGGGSATKRNTVIWRC